MKLIKVHHLKKDDRYLPLTTLRDILREVFNTEIIREWQGVTFDYISSSGYSIRPLPIKGIQMTVGDYGKRTIRKVMVNKDGYINADTLLTKFAELRCIVEVLVKRQKEQAERISKSTVLWKRIVDEVGYASHDYRNPISLDSHTPDTVRLDSNVNATQLLAIEQLLGEQKVNVKIDVPERLAVSVYNIMKGVK